MATTGKRKNAKDLAQPLPPLGKVTPEEAREIVRAFVQAMGNSTKNYLPSIDDLRSAVVWIETDRATVGFREAYDRLQAPTPVVNQTLAKYMKVVLNANIRILRARSSQRGLDKSTPAAKISGNGALRT